MAARTLAMAAASSSLCLGRGVQNSSFSRASKEFSTLWVSGNRVSASSVNATRRDSVVVYAGKRATGPPGNGKRPRSGMQARRKQVGFWVCGVCAFVIEIGFVGFLQGLQVLCGFVEVLVSAIELMFLCLNSGLRGSFSFSF